MPLDQDIEQGHRVSDPALEIVPDTMTHFLEMTHNRQHRQNRFNHHAVIPGALGTYFQVRRVPARFGKMRVGKNQHFFGNCLNQVLKGAAVVNVRCVHIPSNNQVKVIQQQTQLPVNSPALVREAFVTNLLRTSSSTARMNQFNIVTISEADKSYPINSPIKPKFSLNSPIRFLC